MQKTLCNKWKNGNNAPKLLIVINDVSVKTAVVNGSKW